MFFDICAISPITGVIAAEIADPIAEKALPSVAGLPVISVNAFAIADFN